MNKLAAMYAMFKKVQEKESLNALITAEGKLDDTVLATMKTEINKNSEHHEKRTEIKFGEETLKFEHTGRPNKDGKCCGHHHHGMMKHHHHSDHASKHCGPHRKLDKMLFMLKMLDQTEYVENSDGTSSLALTVAFEDLPEAVQQHMKAHCCKAHEKSSSGCCDKFDGAHKWLASCGCMDLDPNTLKPEKLEIVISLKPDKSPEKVNLTAAICANDQTGAVRVLTLKAEGQCK